MIHIQDLLAQNPTSSIQVLENEDALTFLVQLGLADRFPKFPRSSDLSKSGRADRDGKEAAAISIPNGGAHWLVGFLYAGYEETKDNGYALYGFPKKTFTAEKVSAQVNQILAAGSDVPPVQWSVIHDTGLN